MVGPLLLTKLVSMSTAHWFLGPRQFQLIMIIMVGGAAPQPPSLVCLVCQVWFFFHSLTFLSLGSRCYPGTPFFGTLFVSAFPTYL